MPVCSWSAYDVEIACGGFFMLSTASTHCLCQSHVSTRVNQNRGFRVTYITKGLVVAEVHQPGAPTRDTASRTSFPFSGYFASGVKGGVPRVDQ